MPDQPNLAQIPTFPDTPDIPPMPVMDTPQMPTSPPTPSNDVPDIPPIIADSPSPKKNKGRMIATILGILLLISAVGAGVVLVGQKQLFQQKAYTGPCSEVGDCYPSGYTCATDYGQLDCGGGKKCGVDCLAPSCPNTDCNIPASVPGAVSCTLPGDGTTYCCPSDKPLYNGSSCTSTIPDCPNTDCNIPSNISGAVHCKLTNGQESYCCPTINPLYNGSACISTSTTPTTIICNSTEGTKKCFFDNCDPNAAEFCGGQNNQYKCCNAIAEWGWDKSSPDCTCPAGTREVNNVCLSYNSCTWTGSNAPAGVWCPANTDPSCTSTTPPRTTPTPRPENCGRCSNLPGKENCWVTWTDLDGGCDSDYYNNRVENCPDSRCAGTPTPTPTGALRACNASCQANSQCSTGYCTTAGVCRNHDCPNDTDCICAGTSTPTPTPTPGINAMCSAVKAYDTNWKPLTSAQLSALKAGDKVRFTISGIPADQIDKARFTINGVLGPETTVKKQGTNEYYYEYTIPTGVISFTVTAQIHHLTLGWF